MDIMKALSETPLPNLFVVAGIAFLILAITDKVWTVVMDKTKQRLAIMLGVLFTLAGMGFHLVPVETAPDRADRQPHGDTKRATQNQNIEREFLRLNSYDLGVADSAVRELQKYASLGDSAGDVYGFLERHLQQLKAPFNVRDCFDGIWLDSSKCNEGFLSYIRSHEERRVAQATDLIGNFTDDQQKVLYEILLSSDRLWFGRLLAAEQLSALTGTNSAWKVLLDAKENENFPDFVFDELERKEGRLAESVLLWALDQPHLRNDAVYAVRHRATKSPALTDALVGILSKVAVSSYTYKITHETLAEIEPETLRGFAAPEWRKPTPPWEKTPANPK